MQHPRKSLCYYPTSTVLVEDNTDFLKMLELGLDDHLIYGFNDPQAALTFLSKNIKHSFFPYRCITADEEHPADHYTVDVNIRKIHEEIYNPDRFAGLSVIVVDYGMPDINGLEICRELKNADLKKILLTAEAGRDVAIQAFNNRIIDKFIEKTTPNLVNVVAQAIVDLKQQFFLDLSDRLLNHAIRSAKLYPACLNDDNFINFFEELCHANHIVEYYLMDEQGAFLLLNAQGAPSWLAVKTEEEMENLYRHAELEQAPDSVIEALKTKQALLYFHTDADLQTPPQYWARYLHSATPLKGKEYYYYAYITQPDAYDIMPDKVLSYDEYTTNLNFDKRINYRR